MAMCLIALGANLGDRQITLDAAVARLTRHPVLEVVSLSNWHDTRPIGGPTGQEDFLNGAALVSTSLEPLPLLKVLQQIENELGRTRGQHWAARTIDLDLLLYDQQVIDLPELQIPHPRMSFRRFVLEPAVEVAATTVHPTTGLTLEELLAHLDQSLPYVALCGPPAVGKTRLAMTLQEKLGATLVCDTENFLPENTSSATPSSPGFSAEIELLERRASQLDRKSIEVRLEQSATLLVSDFGLHQSLAYAKLRLTASQYQKFSIPWEKVLQQVASPKLLISLDAPTEVLFDRIESPHEWSTESLETLRSALKDAIAQFSPGPILQLDATEPDIVLTETIAAIEAMAV